MKNYLVKLLIPCMAIFFVVSCQKESDDLISQKGTQAQIEARSSNNFTAPLSGDNEVPPNESDAHGVIIVKIAPDESSIDYRLIVSNADDVMAAHFHLAAEGVNGPVVAHLYGGPATSKSGVLAEGTITAADVVGPLAGNLGALIDTLRAGYIYTNVHTVLIPGGEIRGQID